MNRSLPHPFPVNERLRSTRSRAQLVQGKRDWYHIENAASDTADVFIYDEIGFWGITAADFVRDLRSITAKNITLRLNTPGGEVFDGIAIYTALKDHHATVEVRIDSLAASIGSVIAMAGDRVVMAKHSTMMIHEPFALAIGDAEDMRKLAETLDLFADNIASFYAERAGGSVREWRDRMRAETWYSDQAAVDAGLADEIAEESSAKNNFDLSIFRHTPEHLQVAAAGGTGPTKREAERALRDVGLSSAAAKAVIARGWEDGSEREVADLSPLLATLRSLNQGRG